MKHYYEQVQSMFGSETMLWKGKERSRIRSVQMENLRDSIGIRRIDKGPNARIRELFGVTRGLMKSLLRCFSHVERMENDRIARRVYVGVCVGSRSVGRPRKRGIYTVKDCLKKEIWISGKQGEWCMVECV